MDATLQIQFTQPTFYNGPGTHYLCIYEPKIKPTVTSTSHVITKYVPVTICPQNWANVPYMPNTFYAYNWHVCIYKCHI